MFQRPNGSSTPLCAPLPGSGSGQNVNMFQRPNGGSNLSLRTLARLREWTEREYVSAP